MKIEHIFLPEKGHSTHGKTDTADTDFGYVISTLEEETAGHEDGEYKATDQPYPNEQYEYPTNYPYQDLTYDQAYYIPELEMVAPQEPVQELPLPQPQDYYVPVLQENILHEQIIIEEVAQALKTQPTEIVDILTKENIQPQQLEQPAYQHKIVQEVYKVQEPAQLLQIEEIAQVFEDLSHAVEKAVEIYEKNVSQAAKIASEIVPQEQATTAETVVQQVVYDNNQTAQAQDNQTQAGQLKLDQSAQLTQQTEQNTQTLENVVVEQQHQQAPQAPRSTSVPLGTTQAPDAPQILEQINAQIKKLVQTGPVTEMRIALYPENLGELNLRIVTQNGIVVAQFMAQNQRVKEIIESNLANLQEELEKQGLQVNELSVSIRQENQSQMDAYLREQGKSRQRISTIINNIMEEEQGQQEIQLEGTTVSYSA